MGEEANVQLIREAYAAFQRGDIQSILRSLSGDVEWVAAPVEPVAGTYRGPNEVAKFFERVKETAEYTHFEPREYIAKGDRVVVLGRYVGKARATGRTYDCEWTMVFTVTDGKVSRFQEYTDTATIAAALPSASATAG